MHNENLIQEKLNSFLLVRIFRAFHLSVHPPKLILALLGLGLIALLGWSLDFSNSVIATRSTNELEVYIEKYDSYCDYVEYAQNSGLRNGVFETLWQFGSARLKNIITAIFEFDVPTLTINIAECFAAIQWACRHHPLYSFVFFVLFLIILCIVGGAICRITAQQIALGEKPGMINATLFCLKRSKSFIYAPLVPIGVIVFLSALLVVFGLLGKIPWGIGYVFLGLSAWLSVVLGMIIAFLIIGFFIGFNLMLPAAAYDDLDCCESLERSYTYAYRAPWSLFGYGFVSLIYGAVCYAFVRLFIFLGLLSTRGLVSTGTGLFDKETKESILAIWPKHTYASLIGPTSDPEGFTAHFFAICIYICLMVVVGLLVAFMISYYFSTCTIIYALLRKKIDSTEIHEIAVETDI